ncbi:MAG TPA: hypothetical protein PK867_04390 [Pirellulales bacterium]|nr:hypothetical protein [Pirellulales bacterium]
MDQNPYQAPKSAKGGEHTFWFLLAFYALAIVGGIRHAYSSKSSALDVLLPVADAIALGCWALADSKRRGHYIPMTARWWFVLLGVFVVPAYVIWSRGWRGWAWVAVNFVAWVGLSTLTAIVSEAVLGMP